MPDYRPPFAPHVCGTYPERTRDEDGALLPAMIAMRCERCGEGAPVRCDSGRYRERVARWALAHARCPLAPGRGEDPA